MRHNDNSHKKKSLGVAAAIEVERLSRNAMAETLAALEKQFVITPFQQQILSAIAALGCNATQGNIAKRLNKPVGAVSNVLWRYMRPAKTAEAVDWNVTGKDRVWRAVK